MKLDYPVALSFRCAKCGICCGDTNEKVRHVLLLTPEAKQVSEVTLQPISQFAEKLEGKEPYRYEMRKNEDGKCVFLESNCCTIYSIRPLICRFYPFELNSYGGKYCFRFSEECPGIGKGRIMGEESFRKMLRLARAKHKKVTDSNRKMSY